MLLVWAAMVLNEIFEELVGDESFYDNPESGMKEMPDKL
jgi:hypothetical protein